MYHTVYVTASSSSSVPSVPARLSGGEDEDPDYEEIEAVLHSQKKVPPLLAGATPAHTHTFPSPVPVNYVM